MHPTFDSLKKAHTYFIPIDNDDQIDQLVKLKTIYRANKAMRVNKKVILLTNIFNKF